MPLQQDLLKHTLEVVEVCLAPFLGVTCFLTTFFLLPSPTIVVEKYGKKIIMVLNLTEKEIFSFVRKLKTRLTLEATPKDLKKEYKPLLKEANKLIRFSRSIKEALKSSNTDELFSLFLLIKDLDIMEFAFKMIKYANATPLTEPEMEVVFSFDALDLENIEGIDTLKEFANNTLDAVFDEIILSFKSGAPIEHVLKLCSQTLNSILGQ